MDSVTKLDQVRSMTLSIQQLALTRIRETYPSATEHELRLRLASLWLPEDIMRDVFGWDVRANGF